MKVNLVFYGHQDWVIGDIVGWIEKYNKDVQFVRSTEPIDDADVYHILRPNWAGENGHTIPANSVVSHHGQGIRGGNLMYGPETMEVFRDADLIAVPDIGEIAELAQAGVDCDKVRYIPHGVDFDRFRPSHKRHRGKKFRILRVGRRYMDGPDGEFSGENKGIGTFDQIMGKLEPNDFEFWVLAGGDENWDNASGTKVKVINVPYEQYPDIYGKVDLFLITSRSEAGPVSLLEAMACGVPILSTPVGMAKDMVVPREHGYFYPINDADDAARLIKNIEGEEWWGTSDQKRSSCMVAQPHDWAKIALRYRAMYDEVHNEGLKHRTNVRSYNAGRFSKTRCFGVKEKDSPLYRKLRKSYHLGGKGTSRDWEYPAVLHEAFGEGLSEISKVLIVGASNDLIALEMAKRLGSAATLVDPAGFEAPWWFENKDQEIVKVQPKKMNCPMGVEWPKGPKYIKQTVQDSLFIKKYDVAISISVLEHVPYKEQPFFMQAVYDALKPGGRFVLTVEYTPGYGYIEIPELHLEPLCEEAILSLVSHSDFVFDGGQDWNTREGGGVIARATPPHLRERFDDGVPPYFCSMIITLKKPGA